MKTPIKLVTVSVSWALVTAQPSFGAVIALPNAGRTAPGAVAPMPFLVPLSALSSPRSSQVSLTPALQAPLMAPAVLPVLRLPGQGSGRPVSAQVPAASAVRVALPAVAAEIRPAEVPAAVAEDSPVGPASFIGEARAGFRERIASLSRGIGGIVSRQAVSEQFGKLGRLFDSQASRGALLAPAPATDAGAAQPADPRWGERLWERLRDGADPALFGPIHDSINGQPADKQSGYALQYLYLFPIDMALPVLKEHLDGPFRRQVLMALKSYAVLATNPEQRRWADLHIYGEVRGMLPAGHALAGPEIEAAILDLFEGVSPERDSVFFAGDERTYALDLMAVIPSRGFAAAAQRYLGAHWRDADTLLGDMKGRAGQIPSNPFSWFKGALNVAAAQATSQDAGFLADLDRKLAGLAAGVQKELDDFTKRDTLPWGWSVKPYVFRLDIIAGLREIVQDAGERAAGAAVRKASAWSIVPSWFDASGLSFVSVRMGRDLNPSAVLRHGRYELSVSLDAIGSAKATFTKYSRYPEIEERKNVDLLAEASRRAVADILRAAQAQAPVSGDEKAALDSILAMLDG